MLLCVLFYFFALLNLKLLNFSAPPSVKLLLIIVMLVLLLLQTYLSYSNLSLESYQFFPDKIVYNGKKQSTIMLSSAADVVIKKSIIDSFFGTGTVKIEPGFSISHISHPQEISDYARKLVQAAKGQQSYQQQFNQ